MYTVDVGGPSLVAAWEETVEEGDAVGVGRLDAAHGGSLEHGGVVGVAHAGVALDTHVHALNMMSVIFAPDSEVGS